MFLITAIKELNKNPLSHPPPLCPLLPSVSHNCCVLPAWECRLGWRQLCPTLSLEPGSWWDAPSTGTWDGTRREAGEPRD